MSCPRNFSAQSDFVLFCVSDNKRLELELSLTLLCMCVAVGGMQAYLAVPVKAGLHHLRVLDAVQLYVPDTEVEAGAPGQQRH